MKTNEMFPESGHPVGKPNDVSIKVHTSATLINKLMCQLIHTKKSRPSGPSDGVLATMGK